MSRRLRQIAVAGALCLVASVPLRAAGATAEACKSPSGTLSEFLTAQSMGMNTPKAATAAIAEAGDQELKNKPTADGIASGGRLDLLRRAFVGFKLGDVAEQGAALVFNFNPDAFAGAAGRFSPRLTVHQATIYGPLDKQIDTLDEAVRAGTRDEIKKGLGELDDYEVTLRWALNPPTPAQDLQTIASGMYDRVAATVKNVTLSAVETTKANISRVLPPSSDANEREKEGFFGPSMERICASDAAVAALNEGIALLETTVQVDNESLRTELEEAQFFKIADLIDGDPRLVFDGSTSQRSGAAGPDEAKLSLTYQMGWVSFKAAKRYALRRCKDPKNAARAECEKGKDALTVDAATEYLKIHDTAKDTQPLFSLSAEYDAIQAFDFGIPGVAEHYGEKATHKISAKATGGLYIGKGTSHRLELTATYDDVSNDATLQDRFIAELSWVEQLNKELAEFTGGSDFVVSFVYANKPEFRGEVNKDFGVHAGLKWSFGDAKK